MNRFAFTSYPNSKPRMRNGFTLVELMIAIVLGLLLTAVVAEVYLNSKKTYRVSDNLSRVQENGRYFLEELGRDIRMAGYIGCAKFAPITNNAIPATSAWLSFSQAVNGYELPSVPGGLTVAEVLAGTDVIKLQRAIGSDVRLTGNMGVVNANIQIGSNPYNYVANDILLIADCTSADIFRTTNVSVGVGTVTIAHSAATNSSVNLSKPYGIDAELMKLSTNIYYIGTGAAGCPANTLCRKVLSGITLVVQPLIDNVENIQIEYGEDTNADTTAEKFVDAGSVGNWSNVVSVRFSLLLRTGESTLADSAQTYTFRGTTYPASRYLRRVYTETVTIRNKTL